MKKIIVLIFLLLCFGILANANPIEPIILSEIYFDGNGDWSIELYDYLQIGVNSLDLCTLMSLSDTAHFNTGISFTPNDTLVVTNSDMQTDFFINKDGDILTIYGYIWGGYIFDSISWGDTPNSHVNAPYSDQSLCRVAIGDNDPYFLLAKENQPSLGYNPFDVQTFGGIQGNVSDCSGYPIEGVQVDIISPISLTVYVDEGGYFLIDGLYAMNYTLSAYKAGYSSIEVDVTVEPDSISGVSFLLVPQSADPQPQHETISISNHPNPFYDETTIQYSLPKHNAGMITIFNSKGQKIRKIPVSPTENSVLWSGLDEKVRNVPSGVYFYNLESEDKILASGKMLYLR
jgi:hypothetical protein